MSAHHMITISRFQNELNRLFDEALNLAAGQPGPGSGSRRSTWWRPRTG